MKKIVRIGLAAGALMAALPAQASDFVFKTVNQGTATGSGIGNAFTYDTTAGSGTISMKVTGWSVGYDGKIAPATLASWGASGLGIYQTGERTTGNYHQIDNVNGWEFAALQFDRPVTLTSGTFYAYQLDDRSYTDNDAFISGTTLTGNWNQALTAATLGNLGSTLLANGINTDSTKFANPFNQTFSAPKSAGSNLWIVGGSFGGPDDLTDAFKLAQIGGSTVSAVPEPASWAMMLAGVGMMGYALRRRGKSAAAATCAA